jgi:hypothetical protein
MGDATAQYYGCSSEEYAHRYEINCDCSGPPSEPPMY